jgi:hypothetical protein
MQTWDVPVKSLRDDMTHIRVGVVYRKGQGRCPRGYYLSVNPVKIDNGFVVCPLGRGRVATLAAVVRSSKKLEESVGKQISIELMFRLGRTWDMVVGVADQNCLELEDKQCTTST